MAANVAARTVATGIAAPLMLETDRVALAPVLSPTQADALMFGAGGRQVIPRAVQQLSPDLSRYFRPTLLPLFPDSIVTPREFASALTDQKRGGAALWIGNETPDGRAVAALGRRLRAQYILLARISDLEMALAPISGAPASGALEANPRQGALPADGVPPDDSATAESVGALVRVSDGAVLWQERATATWSAGASSPRNATARQHTALNAARFSLAQLERRFRQYRRRFE